MKMKSLTQIFLLAGCGYWLAGCSENIAPEPEKGNDAQQIPASVLQAFTSQFPGADNVQWQLKPDMGYAVASFYWSGERATETDAPNHTAWFSLSEAKLDMTDHDIPYEALPDAVKKAFMATEYAQKPWICDDDADVINRAASAAEVLYVINVEKKENGQETEADLYYTADGLSVKIVVDAEPDEDYSEFLPQTPVEGVQQWLEAHYPGLRIIDLDKENGATEVEFVWDGWKHESLFDASNSWIYTKSEYYGWTERVQQKIPAAVMQTLRAAPEYHMAGDRVDETKEYHTSAGETYFCFELEYSGGKEVELYIDSQGKRLDAKPNPGGNSGAVVGGNTEVQVWLHDKYPGMTIIETEYDEGYLEIDILHEGVKKEVKFNGRNEWMQTKWELRVDSLPDSVKSLLQSKGYAFDDREAERVESPQQSRYEVEVRRQNRTYEVYVYDDGRLVERSDD